MKGSGPKDSLSKLPKLTPELQRFIDGMGTYFETQGVPRIGGRLLGVLMIAHWPLTAEDLARILHVSRASISTNMRLLLSTAMVEKAFMPGSRHTHFVFSHEAMEHSITTRLQSVESFKRLLQGAAAAMPERSPSLHHIEDTLALSDVLAETMKAALETWRRRHPAHAHVHATGD